MDSTFMEAMADKFCNKGVTVVRFEFPYMQQRRIKQKKQPPDRLPKLLSSWLDNIKEVKQQASYRPLFIGGKSMGGRIATLAAAQFMGCADIAGVVCLGYPFYAAAKKSQPRIAHLKDVTVPHLIVQGERDAMGNKASVDSYALADDVQLHWLKDGNHDLKPRKTSGFTHDQHLEKTAEIVVAFIKRHSDTLLDF
ncbi:MAG: alpha/beta hydrolase [Endozoicomonas sp. (ex Botrylloides leachii)]|nr:alpha/beta hydrolase [Endozoicomonas sp. (ex Botrylloides leachii)]